MTETTVELWTLLTSIDRRILNEQDATTLALWWDELNRWEWPAGLPDPEDPDAGRAGNPTRRRAIMEWVERQIGLKVCQRESQRRRDAVKDAARADIAVPEKAQHSIKIKLSNASGHPLDWQITDEQGHSLVEMGRVLFPISIRADEHGAVATLRVEASENEIKTLLAEVAGIDVDAVASLLLTQREDW